MRKGKLPTISKLKKKVWDLYSKCVRLTYADKDGYIHCYTCGERKHWKEMQCGHMVAGRGNAILFSELCRPQCLTCNFYRGGEQGLFTLKMINEVGRERVDEEYRLKHTTRKFTIEELQNLAEEYKCKLTTLFQQLK